MTLRIALVGCGAAARRLHLPALRAAGADVVVFAGATRASAEAAAAEWGGGAVADDWRSAIDRPDVDAVDICTPNALHAEVAIAAAGAGKHVLVEKPIAPTLPEADAMIAAARSAGVVLMVAQSARFAPPMLAVRSAVEAGLVGPVRSLRAVLRNEGPQVWSPSARWFTDPVLSGGGALLDLGVHVADLVRVLVGREAVEVAAMCRPDAPVEVDAHALVRLQGDVLASMHVGWDALGGPEVALTVAGDRGTIHFDGRSAPILMGSGGSSKVLPEVPPDDPCAAFSRAVAGLEAPVVPGEDGRAALAIVRAAYHAAARGRVARVEAR